MHRQKKHESNRINYLKNELKGVCVNSHTFTKPDTVQLIGLNLRKSVYIHSAQLKYDIAFDIESYKKEKIIGVYCGNIRDSLEMILTSIEKLSLGSQNVVDVDLDNSVLKQMEVFLDIEAVIRLAKSGQLSILRKSDSVQLKSVIIKKWENRCGDLCGQGGLGLFDNEEEIIHSVEWVS